MMKPGDLVRVTMPCVGDRMEFRGGELGLVIGYAGERGGALQFNVMFPHGVEMFAITLLEVIDDGIPCNQ